MAADAGRRRLDAAEIEEAWSDLQQLPAPSQSSVLPAEEENSVVEFGQLEDEEENPPLPMEPAAVSIGGREDDDIEPSAQLDELESQLAEIRVTELPAANDEVSCDGELQQHGGAGGPEVELVFHNTQQDPFGESFDEEEVIIDRYASLEATSPRRWPLVSSPESRELATAFMSWKAADKGAQPAADSEGLVAGEPSTAPEARESSDNTPDDCDHGSADDGCQAKATLESPPEATWESRDEAGANFDEGDDPADDEGEANLRLEFPRRESQASQNEDAGPCDEGSFDPASDPVMPEYTTDGFTRSAALDASATVSPSNTQNASPRQSILRMADGDDRDIIIIEEDEASDKLSADEVARAAAGSRRREYRQLFARLRQG